MITKKEFCRQMGIDTGITEDEHKTIILNFVKWLRENVEKYTNLPIGEIIEIYLKTLD